jgi:hypothetical protein
MSEPIFHYFNDELPDGHPLKGVNLACVDCAELVALEYGEYMQAWFETGVGAVCLDCFNRRADWWDNRWDELEIKP